METSYYTPDISEFYVGFEFESSSLDNHWNKLPFTAQKVLGNEKDYFGLYTLSWVEKVFNTPDFPAHLYVRVKHLDRSDIESLGWELSWNEKEELSFDKDRFILTFTKGDTRVIITDKNKNQQNKCGYFHWPVFDGAIRNKSELKKIMQMTGISS